MEEKKSHKKVIIIVVVCIVMALLCAALVFANLLHREKAHISDIKATNESCFLEPDARTEYGLEMSYDDLIAKLVNRDGLAEGTQIKLAIDDKELKQGETYKFDKVGTCSVYVSLSTDYKYRIVLEFSENVNANRKYELTVEDTVSPEISGAEDRTITVGDSTDFLKEIKATDKVDGELEVKSEGSVDAKKAGEYKVKVSATDKNGNITEKEFKVTVKAKPVAVYSSGSSSGSSSGASSSSKGSSGSKGSSSSGGFSSSLAKGGYSSSDKNAAEKDRQARAVAQKIAADVKAKGYKTDLEKVQAAAQVVSSYYYSGSHVEEGVDYRTPYGVFVKHESSCAGCTRALILVLSYMGYNNTTHANENQWTHQWVILTMDGKKGYADGQVGMAGYGKHPVEQ